MSGYEGPTFNHVEHLFHEATLELVEALLDGRVTSNDVAFLDRVGPLVEYTELPPETTPSNTQLPDGALVRESLEEVFDITMATNVLGDAVHWTAELIEETGEKLRVALMETAIQNADKEGEEWATGATAFEIIGFCFTYSQKFKEED